ncbi:hypothetical protein MNV49_003147 [Pseudohyphozyma bogoriensis]|nr:hypothetical protein MNV49_003147 [Pseudohyphozyma bogoriensis]
MDSPFNAPEFLEGLEAAGYLQRLDTSEERITTRYQHALQKMQFAAHSEEFLTRSGVHKVHSSTVQFFNEDPVSDPFVHVLVGSLPPSKQALVTPDGLPTSGWTPINSPDEAHGTIHFTVSHSGFWPVTVVFDSNPSPDMIRAEDRYFEADSDSEDDRRSRRSSSRHSRRAPRRSNTGQSHRSSRSGRRSTYEQDSTTDSESESESDGGYSMGSRARSRSRSARRANSRKMSSRY